jgi:catechol 2,3-dioxygenase-like lactoylglutathione lyase family enzyme
MPMKIKGIKETCIYVSDLERTKDFYYGRLGLEIISKVDNRHIFFRAGRSVLLCFIAGETEKEEILPPHGASGSIHFAFEVDRKDYDAAREEVAKSIAILHDHQWKGGLRSFYFHDPDKNLVEIIESGVWDKY